MSCTKYSVTSFNLMGRLDKAAQICLALETPQENGGHYSG